MLEAGEGLLRRVKEADWSQKLATELLGSAAVRALRLPETAHGWAPRLGVRRTLAALEAISRWNDPRGLYTHCLCAVDD